MMCNVPFNLARMQLWAGVGYAREIREKSETRSEVGTVASGEWLVVSGEWLVASGEKARMTRGWGGGAARSKKLRCCAKVNRFAGDLGTRWCQMRMNELTPKQFSSVPCPTCGVAAGMRCLLHSGAPRVDAHIDRKLTAAEAIETKRLPRRVR